MSNLPKLTRARTAKSRPSLDKKGFGLSRP